MSKHQQGVSYFCPDFSRFEWDGWGSVIKLIRDQLDKDQENFGRLLGDYNQRQISRYERQQSLPDLDFWRVFAATFRLNLNYVFMGLGNPHADDDFNPKLNEKRRKEREKLLATEAKKKAKEEEERRAMWMRLADQDDEGAPPYEPPAEPKRKPKE